MKPRIKKATTKTRRINKSMDKRFALRDQRSALNENDQTERGLVEKVGRKARGC
jgi:hypothetical protein